MTSTMPDAAGPPETPPGASSPQVPSTRRAAPPSVLIAALVVGAGAAVLLRAGPPGAGITAFALLTAAVAVAVGSSRRRPGVGPRRRVTRWQVVHGAGALLLTVPAAVLDARWVVVLDLLAAPLLATLALAPTTTWSSVLSAPARALWRVVPGTDWLARGAAALTPQRDRLGAWLRGACLTLLVLAVFVPLLASADSRFAALVPSPPDPGSAGSRLVVFVVFVALAGAALHLDAVSPREVRLRAPVRQLGRTSEWLPPLAVLDTVFAIFLAVQVGERNPGATFADAVHAGFGQLVAATALVLAVVASAVRWTTRSPGVRAGLGALCLLTLGVDGVALARLHAYVGAYGLTRLRVAVAVICLASAAILVLLIVAGGRASPASWVPNGVVTVVTLALLGLSASNPDAAIARSILARGAGADSAYASTLSADAAPTLLRAPGWPVPCSLDAPHPASARPWTSANLSRHRARALAITCGSASTPCRQARG